MVRRWGAQLSGNCKTSVGTSCQQCRLEVASPPLGEAISFPVGTVLLLAPGLHIMAGSPNVARHHALATLRHLIERSMYL